SRPPHTSISVPDQTPAWPQRPAGAPLSDIRLRSLPVGSIRRPVPWNTPSDPPPHTSTSVPVQTMEWKIRPTVLGSSARADGTTPRSTTSGNTTFIGSGLLLDRLPSMAVRPAPGNRALPRRYTAPRYRLIHPTEPR